MNLFIVRDFARAFGTSMGNKRKKKKKSILSQEALWQNKLLHVNYFQQRGWEGEGNIILALSILSGVGGSRYTKILHGRSIFQGPGVLRPIPMEPYTTCDFPVGPGLPAPSGSVLVPSLDSDWICLFFILYVPVNDISVTSGRFFLC